MGPTIVWVTYPWNPFWMLNHTIMPSLLCRRLSFWWIGHANWISITRLILYDPPGVASAGGILLDLEGKIEQTFAWGIRCGTNNEAEWMALLQGLMILVDSDLYKVAIFGDSRHVIYKMLNGYTTGSIKCHWLYDKTTPLLSLHYEFYHILRSNNVDADDLANVGASLPQGNFQLNGVDSPPKPIP